MVNAALAGLVALLVAGPAVAQSHDHGQDRAGPGSRLPTQSGQDAFSAISEIVAILDADPATDWSRVDLEALRRHLIMMRRVVVESEVTQRNIPGGLEITAIGRGPVETAIREMVTAHAGALNGSGEVHAEVVPVEGGIRLSVTAGAPEDAARIARLRGLGFSGLLVLGNHHAEHHLMIARGETPSGHSHQE